jgi:hypothetical protein
MGNGPIDGFTVAEIADAYHAMESLLVPGGDFGQDEHGLLAAVVAHLDGADSASITELRHDAFSTLAATDQDARDADALQYELRSGPCVDAVVEGSVFTPIDLRTDERWPVFGPKVAANWGFTSMLSLRLLTDVAQRSYGLNVYSRQVDAFDKQAVLFALLVGTYASSVVVSSDTRGRILNLEKALESNRQIGMAIGVVMTAYGLTRERSFDLLRLSSMNQNRKLRDVAQSVVLTGTLDLGKR